MKKKKTMASVGMVLHKIKDTTGLKSWADYLITLESWKSLGTTADSIVECWTAPQAKCEFFAASDAKGAKTPGFENEQGLIVFSVESAESLIAQKLKGQTPPQLEEGGFIHAIETKSRHKSIGKYLLNAAERVISEKKSRVFLFVSESDAANQRFYKSMGYEELAHSNEPSGQANGCEILLVKHLVS
ncbi:MAG: GNAT family N-acetyltransferase [Bdellovibrionota bacterium]